MSTIRFKIVEDTIYGGHTEKFLSLTELLLIISGAQITPQEVGYLDGVTSSIQDQLDSKPVVNSPNSWTAPQTFSTLTVTQPAVTSGSGPTAVTVTGGAHNALTAAEVVDVSVNLARTISFQAGVIANQRAVYYKAPTYSNYLGSVVAITNAATVTISGAPIASGLTISNAYALLVESGVVRLNGGLNLGSNQTVTNSGTLTFANTVSFSSSGVFNGTQTFNNAGTQACILIQPLANTNLSQAVVQVRAFGGSTNLMSIRRNGQVSTMVNAAPADADISPNEAIYWFDPTNGAGKFMVKAKTADGTVVSGSLPLA